jgi:hypothetical protein
MSFQVHVLQWEDDEPECTREMYNKKKKKTND